MTFESMQGHTETKSVHGGVQHLFRFGNDFGASVVRHDGSYGNRNGEGLWEIALIQYSGDEWDFVYEREMFSDVIGWQNEEEIEEIVNWIRALPSDYEVRLRTKTSSRNL